MTYLHLHGSLFYLLFLKPLFYPYVKSYFWLQKILMKFYFLHDSMRNSRDLDSSEMDKNLF